MPQPVSYNPGTPVSGSIQENSISYVVDGQQRNYRGGFGGLSWMSEVPAANNVIFIGNSTSLGRGPANIPLFYPAYNNSSANIVYAANTLPGSPRNFTTTGSAYNWAVTNNFFINNSNNPIPRINADGLWLYVDANQPTSYPQTGTSWYDLSGKGINGALINGSSWNSVGAISFDGVDDYVNIGTGNNILPLPSHSLEAWVKSSGLGSGMNTAAIFGITYGLIVQIVSGGGLEYYAYTTDSGSQIILFNVSSTGVNLFDNKWHHVMCTRDSSNVNIYIDGTLNNTANNGGSWSGTNIWSAMDCFIGNNPNNVFYYYNGLINSSKIYKRALSLAEIKQNYFQSNIVQDGLVFMVDANNLVSYPKSGTTAYPLTSSINGTLINGTSFNSSYGGYWAFDGVDDYISWGNNFNLTSTSISGFVWGWANSLNDYLPWIDKLSSNGNYRFHADSVGRLIFGIRNTANAYEQMLTGVLISPNIWYHLGFTFNNSTREGKIYVNGQLQLSYTFTIDRGDTTADLQTGYQANNGGTLNGRIANLSLYNKTLSSDEVQQNYQATKDKFQGQQIVTNGLVLNLDAANKDSYPGTGTTWTDLSTYGNNGTLINGVGFSPNVNNGVLNFDGVDDYVTVSNVFDFGSSNAMTAEIWAKSDNATWNDYGYLISRRNQFIIHPQLSSTQVYFYIYAGGYQSVSLTPASITGFNQYVLTYNNGDLRAYLNGSLGSNASVSSPIASYTGDTYIGKDDFLARYLDGSIGAVRLYNKALSATEVAQNYNAQKTRFGL
jgi:hypothetical protein